jgi:hypothetical protein
MQHLGTKLEPAGMAHGLTTGLSPIQPDMLQSSTRTTGQDYTQDSYTNSAVI